MNKDALRMVADLLAIDALDDTDGTQDVFQQQYALAHRILSLLASGEWEMVPRKPSYAMLAVTQHSPAANTLGAINRIAQLGVLYDAFLHAAPDPLEEL